MSVYICDSETHGLYGEIAMFQYMKLGDDEVSIIEYPDPQKLFKFVKKYHTVWYNASYDLGTIAHQAGNKKFGTKLKFDDLLYAAKTAYPQLERYSLDVMHDMLHLNFYDASLDKKAMQKSFVYAVAKKRRKATEDQIAYAKADVYTLEALWQDRKIIKVRKKNKAYALDIKSLVYSLNYQQNGLPVDRTALTKEREALVDDITKNKEILGDLNPQSPKQVCEKLGTAKSDKATLVRLIAEGNKIAEVVYKQRRLLKAAKMLETWDHDKVYTFFNPNGTVTGRFNSKGGDVGNGYINAQQISRQYQYIFHNINKKYVTFEADYSTAELRVGASIMEDEEMRKELIEGKDLHIEAAKLTGIKNPTKADRTKGKAVSFGLIFSMSAKSFKEYAYTNYGVTFSQMEAMRIHRAYHRKYKGIAAYQKWCWDNYEDVPIESAMGRRNYCRLGTDASNYATQSSTAEATKWSVHYLVEAYPKALDLIINVVHDAIYMDVPKPQFERWSKRLSEAMQKGYKRIQRSKIMHFDDIPIDTEIEIIKEL